MSQNGLVVKNVETVLAPVPPTAPSVGDCPASLSPAPRSIFASARRRRALVWGVTSTVLSAIGLIGLALFEQYNGMLSELRADLKHFNETSGEYVKKDKLQRLREQMRECTREIQASSAAREELQRELSASERTRAEMAKEMQYLRERLAYLEGVRASAVRAVAPTATVAPDERAAGSREAVDKYQKMLNKGLAPGKPAG